MRHQGKVIVLHEDQRRAVLRFLKNGRGELLVDLPVDLPVLGLEGGPAEDLMTQRPEGGVGQTIVVAFLGFLGQPDAAEEIARVAGRYADAAMSGRSDGRVK